MENCKYEHPWRGRLRTASGQARKIVVSKLKEYDVIRSWRKSRMRTAQSRVLFVHERVQVSHCECYTLGSAECVMMRRDCEYMGLKSNSGSTIRTT